MPGTAITAVKIEGLEHEFTSIPGVREDYIDIILNLKESCSKRCRVQADRLREG